MHTPTESFSMQERDRRWTRIRELMAQQRVELLVVFPQWMAGDSRYLAQETGAVVFPLAGEPTLTTTRGSRNPPPDAWIRDVRSATPNGSTAAPYGKAVAARLREIGADGKRIAIAGLRGGLYTHVRQPEGSANYTSVMEVREALPRATIVDGTPIMTEARYVKSEAEIEAIRRSVQIGEASADALAEHARPGVSEAEVYAYMVFEQLRRGAEAAHVAWVGGPWGKPGQRSVGPPPAIIESGWFVTDEIEPMVQGYTCQVDQPVCVGPMPPLAKEMFDLGKTAFLRACELMRPGVTWGEVDEKIQAVAQGTKFEVTFLLHGRGLGQDGPMLIPTDSHDHAKDDPIRANTVFILKPYAYLADDRNRYNATWGDSVVVREGGAERLGTRPHELVAV